MTTLRTLAAAVAAIGVATGASAVTIDATTWGSCLLRSSCDIGTGLDRATLTASTLPTATQPGGPATFAQQSFPANRARAIGLGVSSTGEGTGANAPELQGRRTGAPLFAGERITIDFARPVFLPTIRLFHLYDPDRFGTDPQEIAFIDGFDERRNLLGRLTLQSLTGGPVFTATTSVTANNFSAVQRLGSSGDIFDRGEFLISNLFRNSAAPVSQLVFTAGSRVAGDTHDYTIGQVTSVPIPLPAPILFALTAFGGLFIAARRRRAAAA